MELNKLKNAGELGIDEEMYNELLQDFVTQTEEELIKLDGAVGSGNFEEIARIAHTIKGSAGNMRIDDMSKTAKTMEISAKEGSDIGPIKDNTQVLKDFLQEMKGLI